ncbi:MAG: OmpH family outer membrane protein [Bacteroidetes bacterium]|nr:OmpH family outer membrane protein [Bacteroidota bacterium]MBS1684450.1 OmpH family outer membrane protein [Bacteroidota bacterium]
MRKLIVAIAAVFTLGTASAQTQKIGHLNSAEILQAMPEYKTMSEAVDKKKQEYAKLMESMYAEYEKKSKEVQEGGDKMTQAVLDLKVQEIKDLEKRIQDFEQKAQQDLQKYAEDQMKPLQDKYMKGVKEVSKDQGYTYIFDIAAGGVVYYPESGTDITQAVKTKIGANLPVPNPNAPAAPKPAAGGK